MTKQKDTIKILGFDNQEGILFSNHFMNDLTELIKNRKIISLIYINQFSIFIWGFFKIHI